MDEFGPHLILAQILYMEKSVNKASNKNPARYKFKIVKTLNFNSNIEHQKKKMKVHMLS